METDQINQEFQGILSQVSQINGVPVESAVRVATVILQEAGKYRRTRVLRGMRMGNDRSEYGNSNGEPATDKQKAALKNFGVEFRNGITKQEASELISEMIEECNNMRN